MKDWPNGKDCIIVILAVRKLSLLVVLHLLDAFTWQLVIYVAAFYCITRNFSMPLYLANFAHKKKKKKKNLNTKLNGCQSSCKGL